MHEHIKDQYFKLETSIEDNWASNRGTNIRILRYFNGMDPKHIIGKFCTYYFNTPYLS